MNALNLIWIIPLAFALGFFCSSMLGVSKTNDLYTEISRLKEEKAIAARDNKNTGGNDGGRNDN